MTRFEHEVLFFETGNRAKFEQMQDRLREWGQVGFELVSVIDQTRCLPSGFIVFMKREILEEPECDGGSA